MNILLITGLYDTKPASGGGLLMRSYVMQMRKLGHRVLLLYYTSADADPATAATEPDTYYIPQLIDRCAANRSLYNKVKAKITQVMAGTPPKKDRVERYFQRDFSWLPEVVAEVVGNMAIDIVQVDFPWMMGVAEYLPKGWPKVFVSHEAQFVMFQREGKSELAQRSVKVETELASEYNAVLTLTDVEADAWRTAMPGLTVKLSTMGVELPNQTNPVAERADKLVFVGSGKHFPNLEGLNFFLTEIWPLVKQQSPSLALHITGKYQPDFVEEYRDVPGVKWIGFVPHLAQLMHGAISIVPIRHGSGIRVKILESMALGAPVVSTPMAAEGIAANHGSQIMLAPDVVSFAAAIQQLIASPALYQQMAEEAKGFVNQQYGLEVCTQRRVDIFKTIINASNP